MGIDGLLGPTETLVIADAGADPKLAAADLLAQAEHDVLASAILLTPSMALAEAVRKEISQQVALLERKDIVLQAMDNRSGTVITAGLGRSN